jgi:hypothetical protein
MIQELEEEKETQETQLNLKGRNAMQCNATRFQTRKDWRWSGEARTREMASLPAHKEQRE